jgi:hypothetical protein
LISCQLFGPKIFDFLLNSTSLRTFRFAHDEVVAFMLVEGSLDGIDKSNSSTQSRVVPQRLSTTSFPFREGVRAADQEKQVFPLVALRAKKCCFTFLKLPLYYTEKKNTIIAKKQTF